MKNLLMCLLALVVVAPAWGGEAAFVSLGVAIEFKGPPKDVADLVAKLKKDPVYKAATCESVNESKVACAKADGGLLAFLDKNAPAAVKWSISAADGAKPCPAGCAAMPCPSIVRCCTIATPHQPCP